jgi:tetratricopeptide (TPR) repeat protein
MERSVDSTLEHAQDLLYRDGPKEALEFLRESPHVGVASVVAWMHALVCNHHKSLPSELLAEPFLDPVYCACSACPETWLVSPLAAVVAGMPFHQEETGYRCVSCGRVLCIKCARSALKMCSCGGAMVRVDRPTGRNRPQDQETGSSFLNKLLKEALPKPVEQRAGAVEDLHLFFGHRGRVPIGVDASFPLRQTAAAANHLDWAEALLDGGIYCQALQQLALVGEPDASSARAAWLRARMELIRYRNGCERSRRRLEAGLGERDWWKSPERIDQWLDQAIRQSPDFGPAWLTAAEVALDVRAEHDAVRALTCAQNAHRCLGDTPPVLMILGRALRAAGRPAEAVQVLRRITDSAGSSHVRQQLQLAQWEARCQAEPIDVEAHFELARWNFSYGSRDRARELSSRLVSLAPDRPEGYYGLAHLLFACHDPVKGDCQRYNEAYELCQESLARNPRFGFAIELLGSIFRNVGFGETSGIAFTVGEPLEYFRRALECDSRCDTALWCLATEHLNCGELEPALTLLERAAELETTNSEVYRILAAIYQGKHRTDDRVRALRKADDLSPDTVLSGEFTERILRLCGYEL